MRYEYQIIFKRWLPILKEYERTKSKITPRPFKFVKDLCRAHHISAKELRRYYETPFDKLQKVTELVS